MDQERKDPPQSRNNGRNGRARPETMDPMQILQKRIPRTHLLLLQMIPALATLDSSSWLADSGCSSHIVKDKSLFVDYIKTPGHKIKGVGESAGLGRGTVKLIFKDGKRFTSVTLKDTIHCPTAPYNLISLSRMTDAGATYLFR